MAEVVFSGTAFFAFEEGAFFGVAFFVGATFLAGAFFAAFLVGTFFAASLAALIAAHLFRCAAAMRFRTDALIFRFLAGGAASFAALAGAGFAVFFAAAQRLRCASAIRCRASLLSLRLFLGFEAGAAAALALITPVKTALASCSLVISESIAATMV